MRLRSISGLFGALGVLSALAILGCGKSSGTPTAPSASPSAPAASSGSSRLDAMAAQGARSYEHYCQLCHAKDATGYAADNAPSLVTKTFLESASDELIASGIRMGRPGSAMAAYGKARGGPLDDPEIRAIVRFLRSKGPRNIALPPASSSGREQEGAVLFDKNCASCHGTLTVRGNALNLFNPELLSSVSPAFLRYAIMNGRAPTPMPAFQGKLTEQEVADIVAWLWSFRPAAPTAPVQNPTVPDDLPIVINPKGGRAKLTLREERFVSAEQVKKALDAKQRIVIIDARPPSDWIQFHIPGAISMPYHDKSHLERVPNDGTWVIAYCACPHHASGEVVDALRALKYSNTAVLDEGILFWRDKGYPLAGESVPKPGPAPKASSRPTPAPKPSSRPAPKASSRPAPAPKPSL